MVVSMPVPFCGRDGQLAALSEQLDRARGGAGTVVSGHLRHVLAKLGVNSRVDLARIAAGHGAGHEAER